MISSMGFEEMCSQTVESRSEEGTKEEGIETEAMGRRFPKCLVGNTIFIWYH